MEKLTRVKKYEDLRKSIETDNCIDSSIKNEHDDIQQPLQNFDTAILKKVDIKSDDTYIPEREKSTLPKIEEKEEQTIDASFKNEYLDDFIKEVREYNIRKGNRECENTQVDILYQLNSTNREKRAHYVEPIQDFASEERKKPTLSKEDIALEVQNLLKQDLDEEIEIETEPDANLTQELSISSIQSRDDTEESFTNQIITDEETLLPVRKSIFTKKEKVVEPTIEEKPVVENTIMHKKILEETQQLRVQMDEYEDELTDLSDGVEKTNKLLNFVLCFLVLVLLAVIGFIVYSLMKAKTGGAF